MSSTEVQNPILRGFNPDPSIIRVGEDFYIATSTFEWFPGVQIHHSRDLKHWRLITRPLDRLSQLNLMGVPASGGIWAPCLTYDDGTFYLVYTIVRQLNGSAKDTHNYLVTATDIGGPWSEPVFLNSSGFDPSLYHDEDGRKWLLNMVHDHRPDKYPFYGVALQEYDAQAQTLVGHSQLIFKGTDLGCTEGPHIYRRNGYYYLMLAEGGTSWEHCVTLARSTQLQGPYELHPQNPILTANGDEALRLQKTGHADLVETADGRWYLAHLCSRPVGEGRHCILGRESALQNVEWRDNDWLYLSHGGNRPSATFQTPDLPEVVWELPPSRDSFEGDTLPMHYQSPRIPLDASIMSLTDRPGFLRLRGKESLSSKFESVVVARRVESIRCQATTRLEFQPTTFQHMAGLVCYYSNKLYHYLYISHDEHAGNCLRVETADDGKYLSPLGEAVIPLGVSEGVWLQAQFDREQLQLMYSLNGDDWHHVCAPLDARLLSDDYGEDWGFTGTFVGMAVQDLTGGQQHADFDFFELVESES